ncbi:MAG: hypothetical protein NTX53_19810 [candidate division WOR-3 bacterium]|nr:hypothetical protein [candidate division WOR-3 bacterium]
MKQTSATSLVLALVAFCLVAGPGCNRTAKYVEWERTYGGPDLTEPVAIVRSPDSGYVVLANIVDKWTGAEGVWLIRLDDDGDTLWTRAFIIGTATGANDIMPSQDGGFLVSGRTGGEPFIVRVRADGEVLGNCTWPDLCGGGPCCIAEAAESTVVMAGEGHALNPAAFLQRTTPTGYVFWAATCSLTYEHPWFRDFARLAGGGYFICGDDFGLGISETGENLWSRDYRSLGTVDFHAADTAADGGLFLAGCVYTDKGSRIMCARVTGTGELMWGRQVDDPPASGWSVCASSDGGCYVAGGTDETDADDGIVVKFDAEGNIEWQREFNGPEYGQFASVARARDGDLVLLTSANQELRVLRVQP